MSKPIIGLVVPLTPPVFSHWRIAKPELLRGRTPHVFTGYYEPDDDSTINHDPGDEDRR